MRYFRFVYQVFKIKSACYAFRHSKCSPSTIAELNTDLASFKPQVSAPLGSLPRPSGTLLSPVRATVL